MQINLFLDPTWAGVNQCSFELDFMSTFRMASSRAAILLEALKAMINLFSTRLMEISVNFFQHRIRHQSKHQLNQVQ